ncbi:MAG: hypothetical protein K5639_02715 [Eubacterium sp.]|nr:hypothetical protein [Eubacterium sp.]
MLFTNRKKYAKIPSELVYIDDDDIPELFVCEKEELKPTVSYKNMLSRLEE